MVIQTGSARDTWTGSLFNSRGVKFLPRDESTQPSGDTAKQVHFSFDLESAILHMNGPDVIEFARLVGFSAIRD